MEQVDAAGNVITLVHFTYSESEVWRLACMPNITELHQTPYHPNYQRSNDTRAVTCPACKKSDVYKRFQQALIKGLGGLVNVRT